MFGYHVSIHNQSFEKSFALAHRNSNICAFQCFVKSPRSYEIKNPEKIESTCRAYLEENQFRLFVHGSYLLNSASKEKWDIKIESAWNDIVCANRLGAEGAVFHVGKHLKQTPEEGLANMFEFISLLIARIQENKMPFQYILETSAGCGTELLSKMEDLGRFYHQFSGEQKRNMKICIDTCHVFSAGYALETEEEMKSFIELVEVHIQWENVALIHLNDCKKARGCCVDRHENIGKGFITKDTMEGFTHLIQHCKRCDIPMILETPHQEFNMHYVHNEELECLFRCLI
jgi:deoxyribonuclease-4